MKVQQIHTLMNAATAGLLGENAVVQEDLENVVDIGKQLITTNNVDNYVKNLVNHIGKVIFVDRLYQGGVPSVMMDSWEFGSILEKVSAELPDATENSEWNLTNGANYSPDVFYQPTVSAKFFNSKVTFEIPLSFTEKQVKESFSNVNQLNGFLTMLTVAVENSMTVKLDALIMRTINNMIGEVMYDGLAVDHDSDADTPDQIDQDNSTIRCVNLLKDYNAKYTKTLSVAAALSDPDFIRYATYVVGMYQDRMARISTLFNVGGKERFTPKDAQHIVLLSDFAQASKTFLQSNLQNAEMVALPTHETVPYWQGSGTDYGFASVGNVNVKTSAGNIANVTGVIGIIFDRNALGVTNLERRVTTNYNPKAEFYTNFYKFEAGFYNDLNENFVVFFVA